MLTFLTALTFLAFLAVVFTLIMGALSMKGNQLKDRENSNLWMRRRVTAQIVAVLMLFLTIYVRNQSGS